MLGAFIALVDSGSGWDDTDVFDAIPSAHRLETRGRPPPAAGVGVGVCGGSWILLFGTVFGPSDYSSLLALVFASVGAYVGAYAGSLARKRRTLMVGSITPSRVM
jgi:hypothetical protein